MSKGSASLSKSLFVVINGVEEKEVAIFTDHDKAKAVADNTPGGYLVTLSYGPSPSD